MQSIKILDFRKRQIKEIEEEVNKMIKLLNLAGSRKKNPESLS